ncbi:hypothetical protein AALP_AA7G022600 [Arabis alpina]|uniref:Myb domain protein 4r1 n=1 Tax=Arabis alpina TaxID=50452 RepID=A0A087GFG5_ARAAL|nr:hypothetical protein AALP_AA7G022600 [Arabis alpina]
MLRRIKNQLELAIDEEDEDDSAFETLCATPSRFYAYVKLNDVQGNVMNDSPAKKKNQITGNRRTQQCKIQSKNYMKILPLISLLYKLRVSLNLHKPLLMQSGRTDFQASCKRITKQALSQSKDPRIELISTPKCSSKVTDKKTSSPLTLGPPENSSVAIYKMAFEKYSFSVDRKNWTQKENENLAKGLKHQLQETLIREATDDLEGSLDDIDTILEGIKNLEITPEMIRQFLPKVHWDQLDIKNRSAAECEARWMSTEDPMINNSSTWTKAEDDYIRLVTENKSYTDWLDIASEWTPEEEDQLRVAVELIGEKNWPAVANVLQGRNRSQCSNKWKECKERKGWSCRQKIRKRWSSQEVERLKIAMTFFGAENWHRIARFIPGRTDSQCSAKWKETLDHRVNHGKWTEEENAKLLEATKENGVERPDLAIEDFLELAAISLEQEQSRTIAPKKKRKERQKKSDGAATERQPKRRRKGYLERSLGDVCSRQENENVCENIEANNEGELCDQEA